MVRGQKAIHRAPFWGPRPADPLELDLSFSGRIGCVCWFVVVALALYSALARLAWNFRAKGQTPFAAELNVQGFVTPAHIYYNEIIVHKTSDL